MSLQKVFCSFLVLIISSTVSHLLVAASWRCSFLKVFLAVLLCMTVSCIGSVGDPDLLQSHHASRLSLIPLWILSNQGLDCSCRTVTSGLSFDMLDKVACFSTAVRWLKGLRGHSIQILHYQWGERHQRATDYP